MTTRYKHCFLILGLLSAVLCLPALAQEEPTAEQQFGEQLEVTAVEVMIDVHDKGGAPVLGLTADDFLVWEDGEPVQVLGLDYPPPASRLSFPPADPDARPSTVTPQTATKTSDWRFLIYVDAPLSGQRSVRRAMGILEGRVDELVRQGPVEVVIANPTPQLIQPFTRDTKKILDALELISDSSSRNLLKDMRRDYLRQLDTRLSEGNGPTGGAAAAALESVIRSTVRREYHLVEGRIRTLSEWMGAYGDVPASAAIIVSDGFDLEPSQFYLDATSLQINKDQLQSELQAYRVEQLADVMARQLSATGWTSMLMSLGASSSPTVSSQADLAQRDRFRSIGAIGTGGPGAASVTGTVEHPLEPLTMVAEQTGGQLITNRKRAGAAIDRLGQRLRLTYVAPRASDGRVHEVRVELTRKGPELLAPRWVRSPTGQQIAASRARRLLVMDSDAGELPVGLSFPTVGPRKSGGTRVVSTEVAVDLNVLRSVLSGTNLPLALTVGIDVPGSPPYVHRIEQDFQLPESNGEAWPDFLYQSLIEVPAGARRVSIVVEEPKTGIWGGAVSHLDI